MKYVEILKVLCDTMTVSGNEQNAHDAVKKLTGDVFDEICPDAVGNLILLRKCGKENARRILLDAHMDEIGMMVRAVHDGGFVTVVNIGGLDRQILPASDVQLWGDKKTIPGVVAATPPHLYGILGNKTPDWNTLVIDTGCTKEELAEAGVKIGTPITYKKQWTHLLNNRITGQGFDDKCCCAGLLYAVMHTPREALAGDVYIVLSTREEIGGHGADCAAFAIEPDVAIVTDVNFAVAPGVSGDESAPMGDGPMVSLSAVTDRKLTKKILQIAEEAKIHVNTVVEATNTGTNANTLVYSQYGVPAAVVSIPLGGMHSYNEYLSLDDGEAFAKLIQALIANPVLTEGFDRVTEKGGQA
ncbi:MAG: M20/M25/M40 family metallo-hydrolase [Clostridia bacterium]|nr:M20/M25/M40 family metallo-hydrolase [Clostridia bacterium]